jgi:hypothetical protein
MAIRTAQGSSSRSTVQHVEIEDEVESDDEDLEDTGDEGLEEWTVHKFKSRPFAGEAAANLVSPLCPDSQ